MRDTIEILIVVLAYSLAIFVLGMALEKQWIGARVQVHGERQWEEGCTECGQFEKNACARDQLQGVSEHETIR